MTKKAGLPKHYDRTLDFDLHTNNSLDQSRNLTLKEDKKLEEMVVGDVVDLKVNIENMSSKLNQAKSYGVVNKENIEQIRLYIQKNHPKFSNRGEQNISNYSQQNLFGLFNGLVKSYENSLRKSIVTLKQTYKLHDDILKKYNL